MRRTCNNYHNSIRCRSSSCNEGRFCTRNGDQSPCGEREREETKNSTTLLPYWFMESCDSCCPRGVELLIGRGGRWASSSPGAAAPWYAAGRREARGYVGGGASSPLLSSRSAAAGRRPHSTGQTRRRWVRAETVQRRMGEPPRRPPAPPPAAAAW